MKGNIISITKEDISCNIRFSDRDPTAVMKVTATPATTPPITANNIFSYLPPYLQTYSLLHFLFMASTILSVCLRMFVSFMRAVSTAFIPAAASYALSSSKHCFRLSCRRGQSQSSFLKLQKQACNNNKEQRESNDAFKCQCFLNHSFYSQHEEQDRGERSLVMVDCHSFDRCYMSHRDPFRAHTCPLVRHCERYHVLFNAYPSF